jgi:hypothetical protein
MNSCATRRLNSTLSGHGFHSSKAQLTLLAAQLLLPSVVHVR